MSVEEDLRATFARHEAATPAADQLRDKIKAAVVRRKRRRAIISSAAAVLAVVAAVPVAASVSHRDSPPVADLLAAPTQAPASALNVLLIVTDRGLGTRVGADTVAIAHVSADQRSTYLISLPRGGTVAGRTLAATYRTGGASATRGAVSRLTGVDFNAVVTVDPATLGALAEGVGGVQVCLPQTMKPFKVGCWQFAGDKVVTLLRARVGRSAGDFNRDYVAQRFLRALAEKITSDISPNPAALQKLFLTAERSGLRLDGDPRPLVRALPAVGAAPVVGITELQTPGAPEEIFPLVGPALYTALQRDDLAAWAASNPHYVFKDPELLRRPPR